MERCTKSGPFCFSVTSVLKVWAILSLKYTGVLLSVPVLSLDPNLRPEEVGIKDPLWVCICVWCRRARVCAHAELCIAVWQTFASLAVCIKHIINELSPAAAWLWLSAQEVATPIRAGGAAREVRG